jgi:ubiquinone biosynthesis monooxygenase Coq7
MRINHAGEVAAQGLYHGQALVSRSDTLQQKFEAAAIEEGDHLAWCSERLSALDSHRSWLTPLWYGGSFLIGALAGIAGDKLSLGFLAETETQVMTHLEKHLATLPAEDQKSLAILQQMHEDEKEHRDAAITAGARELPASIKKLMRGISAFMVKTAYWI